MYTRDLKSACERVAKGCKQCQTNISKNQKAEGLLKGLPIPERLSDKVTGCLRLGTNPRGMSLHEEAN